MGHRYRINKIKRMHSIIHGLLPVLEAIAQNLAISAIIPGRINGDKRPGDRQITLQYYTDSGLKLLARSTSSVQEVFIVTGQPAEVHTWLIQQKLIAGAGPAAAPGGEPARPAGAAPRHPAAAARPAAADPKAKKRRKQQRPPTQPEVSSPILLDKPAKILLSHHSDSEKPANLLEEWLASIDDKTFLRLARKNKDD